ncbi:non-ribosomal peptide synthetase [Kitasatospora gansuensis]
MTLIEATPSKVQTLLDAGWPGADTVLCGGEALAPQLAQELLRTGAAVWNGYGPTETTVYATLYRLAEGHQGPVPIGPPLAEVPIRIVDALGTEVAEGTPGELWIGGPGVARRYLGLPELTAERFVGEGRDRYYRSGDLVRRNAAGDLEFHGRIDQQVKINGVRIELSEIEHVLAEHPAVGTVAVLLEERAGGPGLTAYVAVGTVPVDSAELRGFLADRLPAAMVPSRWLFAAALPLTTGGKIDRRRLGDRPVTAAAVPVTSARLSGPDQELVAEVWQAVLGVLPVRPDDRFFDLGGDSLTAMRAVGQFARRGVVVRAGELMEHTTVAAQAALAARGRINEEVPA